MYKKKLRRLGVACMTVAMVLTTVSFPSVAKAEEGTSTQADGVTSSELEKGKVLVQVDQNVLKANAISNSNEFPHRNGDGSASWAFDNENHWWHSRYTFPESAESPNYFKGETLRNTAAIASENPWIGSGFGREITLYKITYTRRDWSAQMASNGIKKFKLYVSQNGTNWSEVKTNKTELKDERGEQEIILTTPTKAKYFKLEACSNAQKPNGFGAGDSVSAKNIKVYELKDMSLTIAKNNNDSYSVTTDEPMADVVATYTGIGTYGSATLSQTPIVVGKNAIDISQQMTVGTSNDIAITDANATFAIQFTMHLTDAASGNIDLLYKADTPTWSKNEFSVSFNTTTGQIGAGVYGSSNGYLSVNNASNPLSEADWRDKDVRITIIKSGNNTMYLWVNGVVGGYQDHGTLTGTISSGQPMHVGTEKVTGELKDFGIYQTIDSGVLTAAAAGTEPTKEQLENSASDTSKTLYAITATPTIKSGYTVSATSTDGTETLGATDTRATKTVNMTLTAGSDATIVKAPEAIYVKVDDTNTKLVPVSEVGTLATDGASASVNYRFEDMRIGGALRIDGTKNDYSKTSMRYGYDFKIPIDSTFAGCEWYYGTNATGLSQILKPETTKSITNPDNKGSDVYRSNIVFTNVAKKNFGDYVNARILVKYEKDGHIYSKMGLNVEQDTVNAIAERIVKDENSSESDKTYANGILSKEN